MSRTIIKPGISVLQRDSLFKKVVLEAIDQRLTFKRCFTKPSRAIGTLFSTRNRFNCLVRRETSSHLATGVNNKRLMSSEKDSLTKVKRIYFRSPYRWFDIKVKLFLLRSFFDNDFNEEEFLTGARQAICLVSSFISEGSFKELAGMLTEKATEMSKSLFQETVEKTKLKVIDEDIDNLSLSNMAFVYDEKGRKWVDILVTCHCADEDLTPRKIGGIDVIGLPSARIFNFSFVREFTPGVTNDWVIDRLVFTSAFSDERT